MCSLLCFFFVSFLLYIPRQVCHINQSINDYPHFDYYVGNYTSIHLLDCCFMCGDSAWKKCLDCAPHFITNAATPVYFCENCAKLTHGRATKRDKHTVSDVTTESDDLAGLELLSVICIETSHYVCFTRSEDRWVFFDSYASRISKGKVVTVINDCFKLNYAITV